jgi:hypothetical protein
MCLRLQSIGSFHYEVNHGRPGIPVDAVLRDNIITHFDENPRTSTRRAGAWRPVQCQAYIGLEYSPRG